MTDWKSVEMAVCQGDKEFNLILDCPPGKYYYKFYVNNEWVVDESQPVSSYMVRKPSGSGHKSSKMAKANVITVKQEDMEVFQALACDSFATRYYATFHEYVTQPLPNISGLSTNTVIKTGASISPSLKALPAAQLPLPALPFCPHNYSTLCLTKKLVMVVIQWFYQNCLLM